MTPYSKMEARGFIQISKDVNFEKWINKFRGWELIISLKEKFYYIHCVNNGIVIITPKLHYAISEYMNSIIWHSYKVRYERERLGITLNDIANVYGIMPQTIIRYEMGEELGKTTINKLRKSYKEWGIMI